MPRSVRSRVAIPLGLAATSFATGALVSGQAYWAKRRDLPVLYGGDASGTEGDPSLPHVHVACAGDSTLTGPGLGGPEHTWVRVAARAAASDVHVVLRSFAAGGACAGDVLDHQLDGLLASAPDVAVVAVGSNDALRFTPLGELESAFRLIVTTLGEHVERSIIGGVGDLGVIARIPPPLSSFVTMRARRVDRIIRRVCSAQPNVQYVDVACTDRAFRAGGRQMFTEDLFHPNEHGHAIWAGVAAPVLAHAIRHVTARHVTARPASPEPAQSRSPQLEEAR